MAYILLPSSRLAFYLAESLQLQVLPIRAEQYLAIQHKGLLAISYFKSVSFYSIEALRSIENSQDIKPIKMVSFNKKIEGLTCNQEGTCFISDKFGDIYSIDSQFQQKYLNSNLGIPTLLKHLTHENKEYIAVGDQDTRIKIYNQSRMHEIISFWFLIRRVPLQILQTTGNTLVLLAKKQNQINLQMHEQLEEFVQLYQLSTSQLAEPEFKGRLFHVSREQEEGQQCKYQTITHGSNGNLILLKLFSNKIALIIFTIAGNHYQMTQTRAIGIDQGDWDYLSSQITLSQGKQALVLSFGRSYSYDQTKEPPLQQKVCDQRQGMLLCSFNKDEHVIIYNL